MVKIFSTIDDTDRMSSFAARSNGNNSQAHWGGSRATAPSQDECEAENEHGGDVLDEPHDREADEPSLAWTEAVNQVRRLETDPNIWLIEDGEQDGGDMPEGGDEREHPDHY